MRRLIYTNSRSSVFLLCLFFLGCYPSLENELEFMELETSNKPRTKKEIQFKKELENRGFSEVTFSIPKIGYGYKLSRNYSITMFSNKIVENDSDLDTIITLKKNIANELYASIIEDSTLYDITEISILIDFEEFNYNVTNSKYYERYCIDSLANWNNFKVVKTGKNSFVRKRIG